MHRSSGYRPWCTSGIEDQVESGAPLPRGKACVSPLQSSRIRAGGGCGTLAGTMVDAEGEGRPAAPAAPAGRPRRGRRPARVPRGPRLGRPARPRGPRPAGPPATALQFLRFLGHMLRQAHADGIFLTASALAFVTMLSLVPLFAAFSFIGTRVFNQYQRRSLEVFVQVLPYSDETVVEKIRQFVDQAGTIHGFGILAFFATCLFAFTTIEETFNKIWNVSRRRPLRTR